MNLFSSTGKITFYIIDFLRGTDILGTLQRLKKEQYLPAATLERLNRERLEHIFRIAQQGAPYYRPFNSYDEVPVLTKATIRQNPDAFFVSGFNKKLVKKTTGGSTGMPFTYYNSQQAQSHIWAGILMSWEVSGYRLGDRVAFLAGSSIIKRGWQHKLFYGLMNVDVLYASPLNPQVMQQYLQQLQQRKTKLVYGYAHTIHTLANYILQQGGARFPHLKGVVCTAEKLLPTARAAIQQAFGVGVYDQYGCNEAGVSAFECDHGKMHLITSRCAYENLPDGSLVGTDLVNEGFVMLKYHTNDLVKFSGTPCNCGRHYPVIESVLGRQNDVVVDMANNVLHASFFGIAFGKDDTVTQYQIAYTHRSIEVNIHSNHADEATYREKYLPILRHHAAFEEYAIKMNAPFIHAVNGKHKEVVDNR